MYMESIAAIHSIHLFKIYTNLYKKNRHHFIYVFLYKFFLFPTALLEKLTAPQLVTKFPAFYVT